MSHDHISKIIQDWFAKAKGASLVLPDGWFGRPFDNWHELSYLEQRPHKLLLELDDQLLLVCTDLRSAQIVGRDLVLSGFAQCVFDWQEYGHLVPHATIYRTGEIKFVWPPGPARDPLL
jgi:hypothetical protein